jgi:hypothetical protein
MGWGRSSLLNRGKMRRPWLASLLGGGMVAVAAGVAIWCFQTQRPKAGTAGRAADATRADLETAFVAARDALASNDVASMLDMVRQSGRVEPLIRRYHAVHPWMPIVLTRFRDGRVVTDTAGRWAIMSCDTKRGRVIQVRTEKTPAGWKLDWEALTNAPGFEWEEFYTQAPTEPRRLRVSALRGSVPHDYFSNAGLDPEAALAVRLFATERGDSVMALVPKASELGRLFRVELTWEVPRAYVCDLRFADPAAVPPRVEIAKFVQKGWALAEGDGK